jgi:hypothetical protein
MKIILSVVLGIYSVAMATFAVSEMYSVYGDCTAGCYKGETAFGSGSSRDVNIQYKTSGAESVPVAQQSKVAGALTTATHNWNIATDSNNNTSGYNFQNTQGVGTPNVEVVFVDDIKPKDGKEVCAQTEVKFNPQTGQVESAKVYLKKKLVENSSQQDLAEIIQHELGHFLGLVDFKNTATRNASQCETTMAQAEPGCTHGLQGSQTISENDVANVRKYASNSGECKGSRKGSSSVTTGGGDGFTDPNPAPIFYPRTCYYFYDAVDLYWCYDGCRYIGTVYYLTDVFCIN